MSVYETWPKWRQIVFDWWRKKTGTDTAIIKGKLYCLDCESRIYWRRVFMPMKTWIYTACPSCEGFEYHMRGRIPGSKADHYDY